MAGPPAIPRSIRPDTGAQISVNTMNMFRIPLILALGAGLGAAGGYWYARRPLPLPAGAQVAGPAACGRAGHSLLSRSERGTALVGRPKKDPQGRDYLPVHDDEEPSFDPVRPKQENAKGPRRILYYRNPMGLPDTSPAPKKDSMGMDYIAVYEGEDDGSTVKVSPGKLQRTGVRSEPAIRRAITRAVRTPGTVKLDERKIAVISLRAPAFIEKVENVTTGDHVVKDQPLMRLYSPEMALASADLVATLDGRGVTQSNLDGVRRRLQNLEVPPAVIAEIERTRKAPITMTWSAPRDGLVLERNVVDGLRAMPGDVLFRLADTSTIWVLADVSEHDLGLVTRGQQVAIKVRSLPGRTFTGTVALIYPQVNTENRTVRVRIEIPNPEGLLLPDMFADVEFATGSDAPVIAVPDGAVIDTGTRQVVIVDKGDGRFEPRPVKVGVRGDGYTEISEGISEGDRSRRLCQLPDRR